MSMILRRNVTTTVQANSKSVEFLREV